MQRKLSEKKKKSQRFWLDRKKKLKKDACRRRSATPIGDSKRLLRSKIGDSKLFGKVKLFSKAPGKTPFATAVSGQICKDIETNRKPELSAIMLDHWHKKSQRPDRALAFESRALLLKVRCHGFSRMQIASLSFSALACSIRTLRRAHKSPLSFDCGSGMVMDGKLAIARFRLSFAPWK